MVTTSSHLQARLDIVVLLIVSLFVGGIHCSPVENASPAPGDGGTTLPPQCAKVTCTSPPEGLKCNKTEIKNQSLLKKVGKLKDCCSAWRCQEEDGSFSTYFGMTGTESVASSRGSSSNSSASSSSSSSDKSSSSSSNTSSSADNSKISVTTTTTKKPTPPPTTEEVTTPTTTTTTTRKPKVTTTTTTTTEAPTPPPAAAESGPQTEKSNQDKCFEAKTKCPMPEGQDSCTVTMSKDAMQFKPKGELDSCCPIYNCTLPDGSYRLHYLMSGGTQPKKQAAIAKEKGEPRGDNKCPNLQCAQEPQAGEEGPVCEKSSSSDTESPRIKELGQFRECCSFWKCTYPDASYYTHFELQASSFWLAETTFQSEPSSSTVNSGQGDEAAEAPATEKPAISGDEVSEADSASGSSSSSKKGRKSSRSHNKLVGHGQATVEIQPTVEDSQSKSEQSSYANQNGYSSSFSNSFSNSKSWSSGDESQTQDETVEGQDQNGQTDEASDDSQSSSSKKSSRKKGKSGGDMSGMQMGGPGGMQMNGMQIPMGPPPGTVPDMGGNGMGMNPAALMMQQQMMMPGMNMYPGGMNMFGGKKK